MKCCMMPRRISSIWVLIFLNTTKNLTCLTLLYLFSIYEVLDYAAGGQLIEWNEDESEFYFCKEDRTEKVIPESELRRIFRDCVKGLSYRKKAD